MSNPEHVSCWLDHGGYSVSLCDDEGEIRHIASYPDLADAWARACRIADSRGCEARRQPLPDGQVDARHNPAREG